MNIGRPKFFKNFVIGDPKKSYSSFQDQLMDDKHFMNLAVMYGRCIDARKEIEEELKKFFKSCGPNYDKIAISQIKLMAVPTDLIEHEKITIEVETP